jgi:hypothetical protein
VYIKLVLKGKNMINSPLYIFDNTGCSFHSENDHIVIDNPLSGYSGLTSKHIGYSTPYLCKNKEKYEIGIGRIESLNNQLILKRISVLSSSFNNGPVPFGSDAGNCLYSFANSYGFRTAFNNFINQSGTFDVDNIRATYLIDVSSTPAIAKLPPAQDNRSLVIDFQTTDGTNKLSIVQDNQTIVSLLPNSYTRLISTGLNWLELKDINQGGFAASSVENTFRAMSTPGAGPSGSIQYNNGAIIAGSNAYFVNNKVLLGANNDINASTILPTSGGLSTVFNNNRTAADFIVNGSGDKGLFFSYDGKFGINIPSGQRPQASLHVLNNVCNEGIRLENRNQCNPAGLTLYHKPSIVPSNNTVVASINLSSKNASNTQVDMVQLRARVLSTTPNATSGELALTVDKAGVGVDAVVINADRTTISATNNNILSVSSSGIYVNGSINLSSLKWSGSSASGLFLMSDSSGNIVLTNINNSPIINLLEPTLIVFTGVCT